MNQNSIMIQTISRVLIFIILTFSIFLLLAGHNAPGGGFIGGLMTAVGFLILYISFGGKKISNILKFNYEKIIAIGMLFALGTGFNSIFQGYPFLTQFFDYFELPILGEVELTTALPFDIGVYLVVVAAAMLIILTIAGDES